MERTIVSVSSRSANNNSLQQHSPVRLAVRAANRLVNLRADMIANALWCDCFRISLTEAAGGAHRQGGQDQNCKSYLIYKKHVGFEIDETK